MRLLFLLSLIVAGALWLGAKRLPKSHMAASRVMLRKSPEDVWDILLSLAQQPPMVSQGNAVATGPRFQVEERKRFAEIVARPNSRGDGTWTYKIELTADGCAVTVSDTSKQLNPLLHSLYDNVMSYHAALDACLIEVGVRVGEDVSATHIVAPR